MVRTSIAFAVVALGLLAYILIVERGTLSEGELERRERSVLPQFIRDRVVKLEVQRKGVTTVLERSIDSDTEDPDDLLWKMTEPLSARADQDAVDTLLGELEWMNPKRRFDSLANEDEKAFGFANPRYRVWFTIGRERFLTVVGKDSPRGDGVYLLGADGEKAFVVGKDLVEALDHEPEHYYTKELHDGVTPLNVSAVGLHDGERDVWVRKAEDGFFWLQPPLSGLASRPAIDRLVDALDALRATRFVSGGPSSEHGLSPPSFELEVVRSVLAKGESEPDERDPKAEPKREKKTLKLQVGAPCDGHDQERYVTTGGPVMCASEADLKKLQPSLEALRERRLVPIGEPEVDGLVLERGGQTLELTRDEGFDFELKRGGKVVEQGKARAGSVEDWLKALRSVRVVDSEPDSGPAPISGRPPIMLTVRRGKRPDFELRAELRPQGLVARRGDEAQAQRYPAQAAELLAPVAARFRSLVLRAGGDEAGKQLSSLRIRRAGIVEHVVRADDGEFALQQPITAPADRVAMQELERVFTDLEAERFVADDVAPEHGLQPPQIQVTARFGSDEAGSGLVLLLGARAQGGRFAKLADDAAVFVLSEATTRNLEQPLVSRSLLAPALESLARLSLQPTGGSAIGLAFESGRWTIAEGSLEGGQGAQAVAQAVSTLRATSVMAFGEPDPAHGLGQPVLRIAVELSSAADGAKKYEILVGARAEPAAYYARRSDRAVTFRVPTAQLAPVLSAAGIAAPPESTDSVD